MVNFMTKKLFAVIGIVVLIQALPLGYYLYQKHQTEIQKKERYQKSMALILNKMKDGEYTTARNLTEGLIREYPENEKLSEILTEIETIEKSRTDAKESDMEKRLKSVERLIYGLAGRFDLFSSKISERLDEKIVYNKEEIKTLLEQGIRFYDQGELLEAKGVLSQALKFDGEDPLLNAWYAAVIFEQNPESYDSRKEGTERILKALETNDRIEIAHFTLARIYEKSGQGSAAQSEYDKALRISPDSWRINFMMARDLYGKNNLTEASKYFQNAIKAKKDLPVAWFYLGEIGVAMNDPDRALESYRKALELDPAMTQIHRKTGELYLNQSKYAEALKSFEKASLYGTDCALSDRLGICYENTGEPVKAVASYEESLKLNTFHLASEKSDGIHAVNRLLSLYPELHREQDAAALALKAAALIPDRSQVYLLEAAKIQTGLKNLKEAKSILSKVRISELDGEKRSEAETLLAQLNSTKKLN
jgi:Tfp pilus assembly protein PilF